MQSAPKSLRLQIAIFGRVNAGKSSFLNLVTGQEAAITSEIAGTTTDVVEKAQELLPLGPVLWLDTAGFGDNTELSEQRLAKTAKVLDRADIAVMVCEGDSLGAEEKQIITLTSQRKIPLIKVYNKADKYNITATDGIIMSAADKNSRDKVLNELKAALIKACPEDFINSRPLLGDLTPEHSTVVMIIPIDYEAPKGRLIMPQVQAIRDCLDHNQNVLVVKENDYQAVLQNFKNPPALVVCDSQVVDKMVAETPAELKCTTFSILMARFKGDLQKMVAGAAMINKLQDSDKILIAESCTHHAVEDDIGRVKIPNWLKKKTGKNLQIDHVSGCDFAANLADYKLVIQCGGCAINRKEILSRIYKCEQAGVAITNYGVCISELKGVLQRVLEPFGDVYEAYLKAKK
ncbi:MAG: [FeFe] hydrogenase H-cluster maturation GTPase HydF [Alphaproteobacteria bacterium]|nr:[FeFe] hydrogenase H-cluster maturation GTPase HydF [Alphaproteobacteria bacterium]MDY4689335.1 [FeFe] hydrogenase H-cluster maturation GTPase HydF [Alphaproteobacteria bacterium]